MAKAIKADSGVDTSRQTVEAYNPNKVAGQKLSPRFRELFDATRKAFLLVAEFNSWWIDQRG